MKTYLINIGRDWSLRTSVEYMLRGMSLACLGPNKIEQTAFFDGKLMFRSNCAQIVYRLSMEISNYGLSVQPECSLVG